MHNQEESDEIILFLQLIPDPIELEVEDFKVPAGQKRHLLGIPFPGYLVDFRQCFREPFQAPWLPAPVIHRPLFPFSDSYLSRRTEKTAR
jgi:hypothetical protein